MRPRLRPLCAVLLAAGEGRRLRPLTDVTPKALCPVGNVALLDRALAAVGGLGLAGSAEVAVNAWHHADEIVAYVAGATGGCADGGVADAAGVAAGSGTHTAGRAHVNVETGPAPLGSAGGLAALRDWIDGRDVLVGNADAYLAGGDLCALLSDRDGDHDVRMLGVPAGDGEPEFGTSRFAGFSLIPWRYVAGLRPEPTDLVREVWRPAEAAGELRVIDYAGRYLDCGTPSDYLAANLDAAARTGVDGSLIAPGADVTGQISEAVVGTGAVVRGRLTRTVVWPYAVVGPDEHLIDAVRYAGSATVDATRRP